jgi:hypothetical protein
METASAPSYSFSANPTTGMYSNSTGELFLISSAADGILLSYNSNAHYIEIYSGGVDMDVLYVDTNIYPTGQILPPYTAAATAPPYSFLGKTNSGMIWDNTNLGVGFVYSGTECLVVGAGPLGTGSGLYNIANNNYINMGQSSGASLALSAMQTHGIIEMFAAGGMEVAFGQGQCYLSAVTATNAMIVGPTGDGFQGISINNVFVNPVASTCIDLHNAGLTALCLSHATGTPVATPFAGMVLFDTNSTYGLGSNVFVGYNGTSWVLLG